MSIFSQIFGKKTTVVNPRGAQIAYWVIGFLFFCYVLIRSLHVGAVYDEVMTMQTAESWSFFDILINRGSKHANNHVLNTLLIKLIFSTGNISLFWARLPNVVSFVFYAYFSYKIASRNLSVLAGLGLFMLALGNPFLLEFFGLARGYGLSIAFMMGSLYFLSEDFKQPSAFKFLASIALGGLAAVSVFSMLYFFLALGVVLNLIPILKKDAGLFKRGAVISGIVCGGFLGLILPSVFRLHKYGQLYYGGGDFYNDTLFSLVHYSLGSSNSSSTVYSVLNVSLLVLVATLVAAFFCKRDSVSLRRIFFYLNAVLITLIIAAHYLAGARYPIDRVALFLYPLFVLTLYFSLNDLRKWLRTVALVLIVAFCGINFALNVNFYKVGIWDYEAHTRQILEEINAEGQQRGRVLNLGYSKVLGLVIKHYVNEFGYSYINVLDEDAGSSSYRDVDFYIFFSRKFNAMEELKDGFSDPWQELLKPYEKDVFLEYPEEDVYVFTNFRTPD